VPYGEGGPIRIEVRPTGLDRWYTMAVWSKDPAFRYSVKGQKDDFADVQTDTLVLVKPSQDVEVRIEGTLPKTLSLCFANRQEAAMAPTSGSVSWGTLLEVPQRCQGDYPNGSVICSPTATSMILAYWSQTLGQPVLDEGVPAVCAGVADPNWPGTGNWSFNTAYAGSLPGMSAFVSRLWHVNHLEQLINWGIPIACSVSYDLLKGKEKKGPNDGHLVVLVGFTERGDPIFNDPGRRDVRQTYKRDDFDRAWATSGRWLHFRKVRTPCGNDLKQKAVE
jgi:hypothetical protein